MPKVLIVEDDPQISKSLLLNLKLSGHQVQAATTCREAWNHLQQDHYDVICLDVGLPDGTGLELCQRIRQAGDETPILFISALTEERHVVRGIEAGGDDYIRKPFGMDELKARIQKVIKRFATPESILKVGPLTIDASQRVVTYMGQFISLGRKELEILCMLMKRSGDIITRENILNAVYEGSDAYDRTIDSHMSHLRRKLREVAGNQIKIVSVYGMGYRLELAPA